jgi:transposase
MYDLAGGSVVEGVADMILLNSFDGIYLSREYVDFRKSIDGLSALVEEMGLDVFGKYLFVFCSRRRNRLKILYWDQTGFALWYKRLEKEKFHWPKSYAQGVIELDQEKLRWLLQGMDVWKIRAHEILEFKKVS